MFGESDSESPRTPSPWDSLSPNHSGIPKLVPEADQGNVEYKLQLLFPTPARFARLVTQLKWRLLEGGGQAYYELGVADSGILVGLPRQQLEESLETLEMMASEIDASVIVVKEIEMPLELSNLAESQLERWDGRRSTRRKDLLRMMKRDGSPAASASELSTTDVTTDTEESSLTPPVSPGEPPNLTPPMLTQTLLPFDSLPAMFAMNVGEDIAYYADNESLDDDVPVEHVAKTWNSLKISSVHKPRPMKKRAIHIPSTPHIEYAKKKLKNGYPPSRSTDTYCSGDSPTQHLDETQPPPKGTRLRGDKCSKQRELKLSNLPYVPSCHSSGSSTNSVDHHTISSCTTDEHKPHVHAFQSLQIASVDPKTGDASAVVLKDPRFIVEALVVRKLSLDEAFIDFEGFSLQ